MPDPIIPPANQPALAHATGQQLPPKTSMLAVFSMVIALLAVPALLLCIGIPMAVVALVLGIAALLTIRGSGGRAKGGGMAWTGIIVSVLMLSGVAAMWFFASKNAAKNAANQPALDKAEALIISDSKGSLHGNSEKARDLAKAYQQMLQTFDGELFEWKGGKPELMISGGKFLCFCQLEESSCAFLVHVPAYRELHEEAKDMLNEVAWMAAQMVAEEHPDKVASGNQLAVGLKGMVLYGAIMTGEAGSETEPKVGTKDRVLLPFFPEPLKVEAEPGISEAE